MLPLMLGLAIATLPRLRRERLRRGRHSPRGNPSERRGIDAMLDGLRRPR
jgi:hypothetical protein